MKRLYSFENGSIVDLDAIIGISGPITKVGNPGVFAVVPSSPYLFFFRIFLKHQTEPFEISCGGVYPHRETTTRGRWIKTTDRRSWFDEEEIKMYQATMEQTHEKLIMAWKEYRGKTD